MSGQERVLSLAERMFGADPVEETEGPPEQREPVPLEEQAFTLEQSVADTLQDALRSNMPKLRDHLGLTVEQSEILGKRHVRMLAGAVLPKDAPYIHALLTRHTIEPVSEEEFVKMGPEARRQLAESYGPHTRYKLDDLLKQARAVVNKNPALRKALEETGLGNHPRVLKAIIDRHVTDQGGQPL